MLSKSKLFKFLGPTRYFQGADVHQLSEVFNLLEGTRLHKIPQISAVFDDVGPPSERTFPQGVDELSVCTVH